MATLAHKATTAQPAPPTMGLALRLPIGARCVKSDERWPALVAALTTLRAQGRRAVRIVDGDCGCGRLLIEAVIYARQLGFTAIEGHGVDGAAATIRRARRNATALHDHAIGLSFEVADASAALQREFDFPADIVLWKDDRPDMHSVLPAAAQHVIAAEAGRAAA